MKSPWVPAWRLRESQLFLVLTIVIGILSGLSAVLFALGIDAARHFFFGTSPSVLRVILVPTLVSLVSGVLLHKYFRDVRGSGVPQTKAAYHLRQGVIPARVPIGKFITGILCIGSGHSMGREGPSVQIGAGLASVIGQWLRLPPERTKSLVPVGASAALAAAFNTPVAAVLFALEEIIADLNATLLGSTVIASIAAVVVARSILGNEPLFHVPEYELVDPSELLAYVVLGVVGGLASLAFTKGLLRARTFFMGLPASTRMWQPAMGGLAIGVLLVFFPEVAGVGYENVDRALNGGQVIPEVAGFAYGNSSEAVTLALAIAAMALLCVVKGGATIVSYSSGNAGGIFAPTLFLGAMVGGIVGLAARLLPLVPWLGVSEVGAPGAYALVGMGALFAGVIRAPMTSVFMIFELTQDYQIFIPLMVANLISFAISRRYQPEPVYHALLKQDQVHLPGFVRRSAGGWRAGDVMSNDFRFVEPHATVETAFARLSDAPAPCLLVGDKNQLLGLVSTERLVEEMAAGRGQQPVASVMSEDWAHVHPDHAIDVVMERFGRNPGVLPVLSRADINSVKGVITRDTLMRVFGRRAAASSDKKTP